jgi:phospholipid/cholesterol/gamma-HCH transport system substrate-binding protein
VKILAAGDVINQTQSALVLETLISQFLFKSAADVGSSTPAAPAASTGVSQ